MRIVGGRWQRPLLDLAYMALAVVSCGFALKSFILPDGFFDGGTTGLSLVFHAATGINLGYLLLPLNLPFMLLGWRLVHGRFAAKTLACMTALTLCLLWVPFPTVTTDRVLVAVFGGMFMGLGNGLALRGGAAFDGLDVLALYSVRRLPFSSSEIAMAFNAAIFLCATLDVGPEHACYSLLIYAVGTRVAGFVVEGIEEYIRVTIVSGESEAIKRMVALELGRGLTVFKGERGFARADRARAAPVDVIVAIVTRLEVRRLLDRALAIDPAAFIVTAAVKEADGGILHRHASY